jgi:hypothetical protein
MLGVLASHSDCVFHDWYEKRVFEMVVFYTVINPANQERTQAPH